MENILPTYNDPLFSILIVTVLVLVTAIVSNILGSYKRARQDKSLSSFVGRINIDAYGLEIDKIPFEEALIYPLSLLAKTLTSQGEYQKAINIYLYLIKNIKRFETKESILEDFGKSYLKGGFLKRSEEIFLEILHKHPRNKVALYNLEIVYELLNDYHKAMETLLPLEIMGERIKRLKAHLHLSLLLKDPKKTSQERLEMLQEYIKEEIYDYRRIIQEMFRQDANIAWYAVDMKRLDMILDILWFLPTSNLNFDIISRNKRLCAIYQAKGVLPLQQEEQNIGIFAIDAIISARRGGYEEMDLSFVYGCKECKGEFPISFVRCPNCYAINSIQIKESIAKKRSQTGYSLL